MKTTKKLLMLIICSIGILGSINAITTAVGSPAEFKFSFSYTLTTRAKMGWSSTEPNFDTWTSTGAAAAVLSSEALADPGNVAAPESPTSMSAYKTSSYIYAVAVAANTPTIQFTATSLAASGIPSNTINYTISGGACGSPVTVDSKGITEPTSLLELTSSLKYTYHGTAKIDVDASAGVEAAVAAGTFLADTAYSATIKATLSVN